MMREVVIPLPTQAIEILEAQHKLTGHTEFVFFSARATKEKVMSENTAGKALNAAGYKDIQTPHGFRAIAKTMQMERLGASHLHTELQIAHKMTDSHGEAYGRYEFIQERTKMVQQWADYLDALKGGKLVRFPKHA